MSSLKDLITNPGDSATSMAYLLIMANVLGLTIYMENKKPVVSVDKMTNEKPKQIEEFEILNKPKKNSTKSTQSSTMDEDQNIISEDKIYKDTNDKYNRKVIDFTEASQLKKNEIKDRSKPLVWKFPK